MRVCVFADKARFYNLICVGNTFCINSLESYSHIYKRKFRKFNYNDLVNNRLKINGCVEKYTAKWWINSEVLQMFTCFNILRHATGAITRDFNFAKMHV